MLIKKGVAKTIFTVEPLNQSGQHLPYFLEMSPRRELISGTSLMRRQFEGGYISRAASVALNFQGIDYFEWALFGVYAYAHA